MTFFFRFIVFGFQSVFIKEVGEILGAEINWHDNVAGSEFI